MSTGHSKLGASASAKWSACPGSLAMELLYGREPKNKSFMNEGSAAHALGELCLKEKRNPNAFIDKPINYEGDKGELVQWVVTKEMADAVSEYIMYVHSKGDGDVYIEQSVDYTSIVPEGKGTADLVLIQGSKMYVVDYKHGRGEPVEVKGNTQGVCYAIGALESLDPLIDEPIAEVIITIVQPRVGNIEEWRLSVDELYEFAVKNLKVNGNKAYKLLQNPEKLKDEHLAPTEKGCRWCKAKGSCKAYPKLGYSASLESFKDISQEVKKEDFKQIGALTNQQIGKCYSDMSMFVAWYDSLKAELLERLMSGENIPGYKAVAGNSRRSWSIEDKELIAALRTAGLLKSDYEKVSIVSPTQAEAALKSKKPDYKKRYEMLAKKAVVIKDGAACIAKESSKKPSLTHDLSGFEDLTKPTNQKSKE